MGFLGLTAAGLGSALGSGISSGISSVGSGMITGAVGGIFGGIKAKKQHKRNKEILALQNQYEKDRMQLQADINKSQAQFNQNLALDMFDYTAKYNSPTEEKKRLEEAGLSPALMYGGGGAGGSGSGSTAGAGAAQGVTALQPMGLQLALQAERQKAEIDALRAQTMKTNAETAAVGADIENKRGGTKLNEAKFKETLKNIDAIEEKIRASKVNTAETEFKNEILNEIRNQTINRYINGDESGTPIKIVEILAGNKIKEILNENRKLSNDEIELLNNKEILTALSNDIEAIAQGEVDKLKIPSENKKLLKKQYERNEWELRNDKALGDILNAIGGNDKYSKLLQGIAKWLFK